MQCYLSLNRHIGAAATSLPVLYGSMDQQVWLTGQDRFDSTMAS